jgi:preprotein translocase subunit SecB
MTETPAPASNPAENSNVPSFQIQRIYLKDLSLEQPNAPQILLVAAEPVVSVEVDVMVNRLGEGIFEVALIATVTAKIEGNALFLVEAKQAGIFEFSNIPSEQVDPMLGISCPTILYPYLRSNIADTITRAGFQPIHLNEINFHGMYEQRLLQAQAAAAQENSIGDENKIILPH